MKITELDAQQLGRVLIQTSMIAIHQEDKNLQETILELDSFFKNAKEWEFAKDLFTCRTDEIADKWYGGKGDIIGFYFQEK